MMPILILLCFVQATVAAVHLFHTGRSRWWLPAFYALPIVSTLAYILTFPAPGTAAAQARPERRPSRSRASAQARSVEEIVSIGSVHERLAAAAASMGRGDMVLAARLYESARQGPYADARDVLLGLARARFGNGEFEKARELVDELRKAHPKYQAQAVAMLAAQTAFECGDAEKAIDDIRELAAAAVGLEAPYRCAELLWKAGHQSESYRYLRLVIDKANTVRLPQSERQWVRLARNALASSRVA
jgi:hypothetical protein